MLITKVYWDLNNYCSKTCSYCPTKLRGGDKPRSIEEYLRVASLIVENYKSLSRVCSWYLDGGEPLDLAYNVSLFRYLKDNGVKMELSSNGGSIWFDWWAIEPYIDHLNLSYHYWQNPALVNYVINLFKEKSKTINIIVPIRPDYFNEDLERSLDIENRFGLTVSKQVLYEMARSDMNIFPYTDEQLEIITGNTYLVDTRNLSETLDWHERQSLMVKSNPSFTGMKCNAGIEYLYITVDGWAKGSLCNGKPLGNIWDNDWRPPKEPIICPYKSCIHHEDQKILKF